MSAAIKIEQGTTKPNTCGQTQLRAILLTATVATAAGSAVTTTASSTPRKMSGKSEEMSDAETDTTADVETVEQDSSTASDAEVEDVDIGGWKEVGSRMVTVFTPKREAFPHGFQPPPGLEPVNVQIEGWSAVAGLLLQGLRQGRRPLNTDNCNELETVVDANAWHTAGSSMLSEDEEDDDEEDDKKEEGEEEEENDKCAVDINEWKFVNIRVLHALTAVQAED